MSTVIYTAMVVGHPVPYGDKRAFVVHGKAVMVSTNRAKLVPWRNALQAELLCNRPEEPCIVPVSVAVTVWFTRPKAHYRTGKRAHELRDDVPVWHVTKPDADKILRAVMDCLTGIWVRDDSVVAEQRIRKLYANPGELARTEVRMERLP